VKAIPCADQLESASWLGNRQIDLLCRFISRALMTVLAAQLCSHFNNLQSALKLALLISAGGMMLGVQQPWQ
jgi:hypothetical protein